MKSAGIVVGVALAIVLSVLSLTCTAKSTSRASTSPSLPLRTLRDVCRVRGKREACGSGRSSEPNDWVRDLAN
jgi:hypothetical protein